MLRLNGIAQFSEEIRVACAIRVKKRDEAARTPGETLLDSSTIAAVLLEHHNGDSRLPPGELFSDLSRTICRAVADHDDFDVSNAADTFNAHPRIEAPLNGCPDACFLVEGRNHHAQHWSF